MLSLDQVTLLIAPVLPGLTGAIAILSITAVIKRWRSDAPLKGFDRIMLEDRIRIQDACDVAQEINRCRYLDGYLLPFLRNTAESQARAAFLAKLFGIASIACNALSSVVTGTNLSIGGASTSVISFLITSTGAFASALLVFGTWDARGPQKKELADLIRLELAQFIAASNEYATLDLSRQWLMLTSTVDELILGSIKPPPDKTKEHAQELIDRAEDTIL